MSNSNILAIFDFDKTLITKDSFRLFSLRASRNTKEKIVVFILAILCKLGLIDNSAYKARVLEKIWSHKNQEEKKKLLEDFLSKLHRVENDSVIVLLKRHLADSDRVVVISASPEFYLIPFVQSWSEDILVFGTKLHYTGERVEISNMYGEAKAELTKSLIDENKPTALLVYTDHISDLSLIQLATDVRLVSPSNQCIRTLKKLDIRFEIVHP